MKMKSNQSRGWRLNNPCCIRRGAKWVGLSAEQKDKDFCTFVSPFYGFRAAIIIICKTYYEQRRVTIRQIIERWAPAMENHTKSYVDHVSRSVGLGADVFLPRPKRETKKLWASVIWAIALHENGYVPNGTEGVINSAFDLIFPS